MPGEIKLSQRTAIFQSGRLGDIWLTLPLANHLAQQGEVVDICYGAEYGNPFTFTPYVTPRPMKMRRFTPLKNRWGYLIDQAVNQALIYPSLRLKYKKVIWHQLFPWRFLQPLMDNRPFPVLWYLKHPGVNIRFAPFNLKIAHNPRILLFARSQSIRFNRDMVFHDWVHDNLKKLVKATGYEVLYVAFGPEPDHPDYPTWRGTLEEYQQLVATCGLVYGVVTSAFPLGQLLGKVVVPLYRDPGVDYLTIGDETARLFYPEQLTDEMVKTVVSAVRLKENEQAGRQGV